MQPCRPGGTPYDAAIDPAVDPASRRFPALEGLRALSALAIVAFHAGALSGLTALPTSGRSTTVSGLGAWIQHLDVGVSVFFVLSGFLLFRPFVVAHLAERRPPATGRYMLRRLVRIFPAYWVALTASVYLLHLHLGDWWAHVRIYGLLQIYSGDTIFGGLAQAWSLCTELSFYLFLPLWALGLSRVRGTPAAKVRIHYLGCLALYLVGIGFRAQLRAGKHAIGYAWLPANTDLFALGMALAVASAAAEVGRPFGAFLRTLGELPAAAWVAAACCYATLVALRYPAGFYPPTVFQELARQILFGFIAVLVVAPGVVGPQDRGLARALLQWRPVAALGVVSYGVYLWHLTVMQRLLPHLTPATRPGTSPARPEWLLLALASTVGAVAVATVSWFGLERPLLRKARSGRGPAPEEQAPTADALVSPPD